MHRALTLHPDSRCEAATRIDVEAARLGAKSLRLRFAVTGAIGELRLPPMTASSRADELWRHTCFEAFVRAAPGSPYYEFNFAPSTEWAAYRFDAYRSGMRNADGMERGPRIGVDATATRYELRAELELDRLAELPRDAAWQLGLSAVIEETSGRMSYWALAHAHGKPDFHHSDCFALELGPA